MDKKGTCMYLFVIRVITRGLEKKTKFVNKIRILYKHLETLLHVFINSLNVTFSKQQKCNETSASQ